MKLRSLLFVPGDRPERFAKAVASGADALILDLEDSVSLTNKSIAREAVANWLLTEPSLPCFVRVNPLDGGLVDDDLAAILPASPYGLVLPKAEGAPTVRTLIEKMSQKALPILPIASETPAAIFQMGSYAEVRDHLAGLTWGAEDLPAAIGASAAREADGRYTPPIELARSLTLFAAHAAGTRAIETVYPNFRDLEGLAAYVARARRDGFSGMMAIHPSQVAVINDGFSATVEEINRAKAIIAAFAEHPDAGVLQLDGKMIDKPHLKLAQFLLSQAGE